MKPAWATNWVPAQPEYINRFQFKGKRGWEPIINVLGSPDKHTDLCTQKSEGFPQLIHAGSHLCEEGPLVSPGAFQAWNSYKCIKKQMYQYIKHMWCQWKAAFTGGHETTQQVKKLAAKLDDPNWIPKAHTMEDLQFLQANPLASTGMPRHVSAHTINIF